MDNQNGSLARPKAISGPVAQNILARVRARIKDLPRPCSVDRPLVLLITASVCGIVQKVDLHDPRYVVSPSLEGEGAAIRDLLRASGFVCDVRRRVEKPLKPSKQGAAPPPPSSSDSLPAVELIFLLYPAV
jgi:hypothetical protein